MTDLKLEEASVIAEKKYGQEALISLYKHKKTGGYYYIVDLAYLEKTLEVMVLYSNYYDDSHLWVRPLDEFFDGRFVQLNREEAAKLDNVST